MNGKIFVIAFLAIAVAGAGGAVLYRQRSKAPLAKELENEAVRASAFLQLLRMNNAWGLANDYVYDGRLDTPGKPYLHARSAGTGLWHVVRASCEDGDTLLLATFIFDEDGDLAHSAEDAFPVALEGPDREAFVALVASRRNDSGQVRSVLLVGRQLTEALRVRGSFKIESVSGDVVEVGKAGDSGPLPVFRYDANAACFRGPPGGSDKAWEVDRAHSPGYFP